MGIVLRKSEVAVKTYNTTSQYQHLGKADGQKYPLANQ
jgi:hypothetical protein